MSVISKLIFPLFLFCSACDVSKEDAETNLNEESYGWMHGNCLAIKKPNLDRGAQFSVFNLGEEVIKTTASVINKAQSSDDCFALSDDRKAVNIEAGYSFYVLKSQSEIEFAIGVYHLRVNKSYL